MRRPCWPAESPSRLTRLAQFARLPPLFSGPALVVPLVLEGKPTLRRFLLRMRRMAMAGIARLSLVVGLGLILAGCSKSDPAASTAAASTAGTATDGSNVSQGTQDATQNQI